MLRHREMHTHKNNSPRYQIVVNLIKEIKQHDGKKAGEKG